MVTAFLAHLSGYCLAATPSTVRGSSVAPIVFAAGAFGDRSLTSPAGSGSPVLRAGFSLSGASGEDRLTPLFLPWVRESSSERVGMA